MKNKIKHISITAITACLLAIGMFSLIGCQTYKPTDYMQWGDRYFNEGNNERAIWCYNLILDEFPNSPEAQVAKEKIAEAKRRRGDPEEKSGSAVAQQVKVGSVTEADFEYIQNRQGGITITAYKEFQKDKPVVRDLIIPAQLQGINVTEIADFAFSNGSYQFTGRGAFVRRDGDLFENVTIPPTVTSIGDQAFAGRGIKTLNLPDSVRSIGRGAFGENQISSVKWPTSFIAGNTVIPAMVFAHNRLTSIDIPVGITTIESGAFGGNQLTELTIPANVTRISGFAFTDNMISKLTFSNSGKLKTIELAAFSKNQLKSVVLPEGLTEIINSIYILGYTPGIGYRYAHADLSDISMLRKFFGVSYGDGILNDNPLVYIKIPSTLAYHDFADTFFRGRLVPVIERVKPRITVIQSDKIDAVRLGEDNINFEADISFNNFYASQGKKAGIYFRRGQIWVIGTQAEFDALIAEKTK